MTTVRKKLGAKPAPIIPEKQAIPRMCLSLQESVDALSLDDIAKLANVRLDESMPQDVLVLYQKVDAAQAKLKTIMAYLTERLLAHRRAPGGFAPGLLTPQFSVTSKVTPKWKEEAIAAATEVANLKGVPFVEVQYVEKVKKQYTPAETVSVDVVPAVTPLED